MQSLKDLMNKIMTDGNQRITRTGSVKSIWNTHLVFPMCKGFPAVTSKRLPWKAVVGELLWFLSKSKSVADLRYYTHGSTSPKWTIWTDDATRWNTTNNHDNLDYVGDLYPTQWRDYNNQGIDQINNLIQNLINSPNERNHIVMAWNPEAIANDTMALKPCHIGFQCYVHNDKLNLTWWQRSWDVFLGAPANIASYALLLHILAKLTNLQPGTLSVQVGDAHLYNNHITQVNTYLANHVHPLPSLELPPFNSIDDLLQYTSADFILHDYVCEPAIPAPLSVG